MPQGRLESLILAIVERDMLLKLNLATLISLRASPVKQTVECCYKFWLTDPSTCLNYELLTEHCFYQYHRSLFE